MKLNCLWAEGRGFWVASAIAGASLSALNSAGTSWVQCGNAPGDDAVRSADITWLLVALLIVMALAIVAEHFRQKGLQRKRIRSEWKTVEQIAQDKQLSTDEWKRLRAMVARWQPTEPLRAVTVRHDYDHCVDLEMAALAKGAQGEFDRAGAELRDIRVHLGLDFIPYGQRIFSTRELRSGQVVTLWPEGQSSAPRRQMRVVEIDEGHMHLAPMTLGDAAVPTPAADSPMRGQAWRDDDARYMFTVPFVREEGTPSTWVVRHTSDLDRMQSRDFFRVHFEQTVTVGVLESPPGGEMEKLARQPVVTRLRGRLTSLSAGGFALVVQQPVPAHVYLRVHLELKGSKSLDLDARIVHTAMLGGGRTLLRGSFVRITEEEREELVRFVTLLQQQPAEPAGSVEARD
jgi:c-di-GMP-binding flagellar brake protein YcgR